MNYDYIVQKAIEKAEKNGYFLPFKKSFIFNDELIYGKTWWVAVIFSHDFAKAFWGEKKIGRDFVNNRDIYEWMSQLQNMVVADNPINYLAKFI